MFMHMQVVIMLMEMEFGALKHLLELLHFAFAACSLDVLES